MDYQSPKIIILVLNWNGWLDTLKCLESLYRNNFPNYQVVLIDNNSEDDSLERIKQWANGEFIATLESDANPFMRCPLPYIEYNRATAEKGGLKTEEEQLYRKLPARIPHPLTIIQTGKNLGFAGGNNVGLRYAKHQNADYVLLLNNDAMLRAQTSISTMIEFMDKHPAAGACGGHLFYPDGTAQTSYGNFPSLMRALAFLFPLYRVLPKKLFKNFKRANVVPDESICSPLPVDYPSGACLLVRKATIDDVGLLDEQFFMYAEETDWCLRMMQHGWERYYIPQAEVVHKYAGSFNKGKQKMNTCFLESLFKYYRKNFSSVRLWIVTVGYMLRSLYSIPAGLISARLLPSRFRPSAKEKTRHWQLSLKLAASTLKDLLSGEVNREQKRRHAEVPR